MYKTLVKVTLRNSRDFILFTIYCYVVTVQNKIPNRYYRQRDLKYLRNNAITPPTLFPTLLSTKAKEKEIFASCADTAPSNMVLSHLHKRQLLRLHCTTCGRIKTSQTLKRKSDLLRVTSDRLAVFYVS